MRAFFGVPIPPLAPLRAAVGELAALGGLKVVDAGQFHLTLKFMGEVREDLAAAFLKSVRSEPLPKPFDIAVHGMGAFPNLRKPNVVWAGIQDPAAGLARLAAASEATWVALGQAPEARPFSPHLTLARRREDGDVAGPRKIVEAHAEEAWGSVHVEAANLYRSTLTPKGPVHDVVEEVRL